jgi:hypothetical protein
MKFKIWLENNNALVSINYSDFEKKIKTAAQDLMDYAHERKQSLKKFALNLELIKKELAEFPNLQQLIISLQNKKDIRKNVNDLFDWYKKLPDSTEKFSVRNVIQHIWNYEDSFDNSDVNEEEYKSLANDVILKTKPNMESIKQEVERAIENSDWSGSNVTIIPIASEEHDGRTSLSPSDSAHIKVGSKSAFFTIIVHDGGRSVDDIIEAGYEDEEFFSNNGEKSDYYTLVQEFENPGSSSKGKVLTLYTARPTKDREFYQKTNWLPANIFLSNSLNHVEGLADDLGTSERRDIYKVKINSKYLVKTLDGAVKYYMVSKEKSPVEYIGLY